MCAPAKLPNLPVDWQDSTQAILAHLAAANGVCMVRELQVHNRADEEYLRSTVPSECTWNLCKTGQYIRYSSLCYHVTACVPQGTKSKVHA